MSEERLQKILARAGMASRRHAEEVIAEGRVTVNGRVAQVGDKADPERDAIKVDGKRLHPAAGDHRYLLLNKPRAVMSTVSDPEGRPTVLDLVPLGLRKALVPVGRLDFLTEGLILLTDDGELAQRVAHPRYGCTKTYEVKVRGTPDARTLDRLRRGIVLDGERTRPAEIEPRPVKSDGENSWWNVELGQGRTRQIREMFQRVGHPVMKLRRVAIGPVRDPDLPLGQLRELSEREVELLRRAGRHREKAKKAAAKAAREGGERRKGSERNVKKSAKRKAGEVGGGEGVKRGKAGTAKGGDTKTTSAKGRTGSGASRGGADARKGGGRTKAGSRGAGGERGGRRADAGKGRSGGERASGAAGRARRPAAGGEEAVRTSSRRPRGGAAASRTEAGGWEEAEVGLDRPAARSRSGAPRGARGAETGGDRRAHRSPEGLHGRRAEAPAPERRAKTGGAPRPGGRGGAGRKASDRGHGGRSAAGEETFPLGGRPSGGRKGSPGRGGTARPGRPGGEKRTGGPAGAKPAGGRRGASAGPAGRSGPAPAGRGPRGGAKPGPGGGRGRSGGGSKPGSGGRSGGGRGGRPGGGGGRRR